MNFFGLGPIEVLVILIVALLVVGPEKLPEMGAVVGRFILDFRRLSDEVKGAFNEALVEPRPTRNGSSTSQLPSTRTYASAPMGAPEETGEANGAEATRPLTEPESASDSGSQAIDGAAQPP